MLAAALLTTVLAAEAPRRVDGVVGADWVPLSRGDLAWVAEGEGTGTLVGELDGLLRPSLVAFGGVRVGPWAVLAGLSGAVRRQDVWTGDDHALFTVATVRPSLDAQRSLVEPGPPDLWVSVGLHGVVPRVRDTADAYTPAEADAAEADAAELRAALGGGGGRIGLGATVPVAGSLSIGVRVGQVLHLSGSREEAATTLILTSWTEAALRLQVALP